MRYSPKATVGILADVLGLAMDFEIAFDAEKGMAAAVDSIKVRLEIFFHKPSFHHSIRNYYD